MTMGAMNTPLVKPTVRYLHRKADMSLCASLDNLVISTQENQTIDVSGFVNDIYLVKVNSATQAHAQ